MTKVAFAKALGVSDPYIHALLSGSKRPTIARLNGIQDALSLDTVTFYRLLNALALEDPDYRALVALIKSQYFGHLIVPLLKSLLDRSRMIKNFEITNADLLESDLWLGWVDVTPKSGGLPSRIRFFLGNPSASGMGMNCVGVDSGATGVEEPLVYAATISMGLTAADIEAFDAMLLRGTSAGIGRTDLFEVWHEDVVGEKETRPKFQKCVK